ncbi:hypothetical protein ES703_35183 [subsurface metagenome]
MKKALLLALTILIVIALSGCHNGGNNHNGNNDNNGDNGMPEFTQIGSTGDCAFWSCIPFGDKIYFGTYGYPKGYNYPPWTHLKDFAAGESITGMVIYSNTIYCSTENKGYIYRMNSPTDWVVVHDGDWPWSCGITALEGKIYAFFWRSGLTETKIMYSSNGRNWSQADRYGMQVCSILPYKGYVYGVGQGSNGKTWARRGTGTSWSNVDALCNFAQGRWGVGQVFNGYLYLEDSWRSDGKSKIYRWNGSSLSGELLSVSAAGADGNHMTCVHNDQLYWLFSGSKMNAGSSATVYYYLYRTATGEPGTWEHVKTFSTNPKSSHGKYRTRGCVGSMGGSLYVGIQNKVYKMGVIAPPVPPPPLEEDHQGANWIISANTIIAGKHTNVGLFKVNPGVTATVYPYNGSSYGTLEVHAADINIGGNIIASGKGYGGGGAGGGGAGGYKNWEGWRTRSRNGGSGGPGVAGGSTGGPGAKGYYHGGAGGAGGKGGGSHGGPGGGSGRYSSGLGGNGLKGGYAIVGGQGDVSIDESLNMGSGGGGAGGGGGEVSGTTRGTGGGGGGGGAGNRGGAWIKLYATSSIVISGNIQAKGLDNSAGNGANGGNGDNNYSGAGGNGGAGAASGGSDGGKGGKCSQPVPSTKGGPGGEGSYGAGGGVLLKCAVDSAISITGTIDNRGGGDSPDDGGTVKIFYAGAIPSIARIYTGRLYTESLETFTETTITCPACGSTLKLTVSSVESNNLPMICPVCGEPVGTGYTVAIITELPWPIYTTKSIICSQCGSELELTISSKPEENIAQVCPVCGAPAD